MFAVLGTFISDRILLGRERGMRYCEQIHSAAVVLTSRVLCPAAGYYTTLPYFLSKIMCDFIPLRMLPPVVFGVVVYWMIGLHNQPERFAMFVVVLVEINLAVCAGCDESTTLTGPSHTAYLWSLFILCSCARPSEHGCVLLHLCTGQVCRSGQLHRILVLHLLDAVWRSVRQLPQRLTQRPALRVLRSLRLGGSDDQ